MPVRILCLSRPRIYQTCFEIVLLDPFSIPKVLNLLYYYFNDFALYGLTYLARRIRNKNVAVLQFDFITANKQKLDEIARTMN